MRHISNTTIKSDLYRGQFDKTTKATLAFLREKQRSSMPSIEKRSKYRPLHVIAMMTAVADTMTDDELDGQNISLVKQTFITVVQTFELLDDNERNITKTTELFEETVRLLVLTKQTERPTLLEVARILSEPSENESKRLDELNTVSLFEYSVNTIRRYFDIDDVINQFYLMNEQKLLKIGGQTNE